MTARPPRRASPSFVSRGRNRVWSLYPAAAGAIAYVVLYLLVQPWLNESSDVYFYLALGLLTLVLGFTVFALARAIWGKRPEPTRTNSPDAGAAAAGGDDRDGTPPEADSKMMH